MPRNSSGIYTLPDSNPVATGEVITSDWANETMTDVEAELSASLPRDGSAPMVGKLSLIDGLESAPAVRFTKDARTGIYRKPDGTVGVTMRGSTAFEFNATGANVPAGKALTIMDAPVGDTSAVNKAYVDSRVGKSVLTIWEFVPVKGQTVITGLDLNGRALNYSAISTIVTMNGTVLQPGDDYVLTNANTVTLKAPTLYNDDVVLVVEIAGGAGPVGPEGPQGPPGVTELDGPPLTTYIYVATGGQTVFTGEDSLGQTLAYKTGGLLVFVAGKYVGFAETDESTITLTTAAALGDEVVIVEVTRAAGLKGDKGDPGTPGTQGDASSVPGPAGPQGPAGAAGPAGAKGDAGAAGPAGAASTVPGPQGPKGDTGAASTVAGPQGIQGIQGPKGDTGATGPAGAKGDTGVAGAASTVPGPQGPAGADGAVGPKGADGTSVNIIGTLPSSADLPATGEKGDAYTIAGNLWVWAGTQWVDAGPIQGPKGDTGAAGAKGDTGATGPAGADGAAGAKGDTGAQGPAGADSTVAGPQGIQGVAGPAGADGAVGPQGPAGAAGADSTVAGPQGPAGPKGDAGAQGPAGTVGTLVIRPVTATAGQTVFAVAYTATFVIVMMNGALLLPTTDYTATDGANVTLTKAAVAGDVLAVFTI